MDRQTNRSTNQMLNPPPAHAAHSHRVKHERYVYTLKTVSSYITDMKEGQKEYQGGSCALDQTTSQQSAMNPQPVLDSTVPIPVRRGMVEVEMSMHSLFCSFR